MLLINPIEAFYMLEFTILDKRVPIENLQGDLCGEIRLT